MYLIVLITGYDGQYILQWLHQQALAPDTFITRGTEIIKLVCGGVTILDTLNYLPMPLAAMPKAFGLKGAKGHFPHFFNTKENWNYVGPLPDAVLV